MLGRSSFFSFFFDRMMGRFFHSVSHPVLENMENAGFYYPAWKILITLKGGRQKSDESVVVRKKGETVFFLRFFPRLVPTSKVYRLEASKPSKGVHISCLKNSLFFVGFPFFFLNYLKALKHGTRLISFVIKEAHTPKCVATLTQRHNYPMQHKTKLDSVDCKFFSNWLARQGPLPTKSFHPIKRIVERGIAFFVIGLFCAYFSRYE